MDTGITGYSFYDLNIPWDAKETKSDVLAKLFKLGVRNVAINQTVDLSEATGGDSKKSGSMPPSAVARGNVLKEKKRKGEKHEDPVPPCQSVDLPLELVGKMNCYRRLTLRLSEVSSWYDLMKSPNLKKYHIIAVQPLSQAVLHHVCSTNDIDIICLDPHSKPQWKLNRKVYRMAIEKGIYFELPYGPVILDSTCCQNVIQWSHVLCSVGGSKNVIVSSNVNNSFYLRSPYDVTNLCAMFGLDERSAKSAMTSNPEQVVLKAGKRMQGKTVIDIFHCKPDREEDD